MKINYIKISAAAFIIACLTFGCTPEERVYDTFANTSKVADDDEDDSGEDDPDVPVEYDYRGVEPKFFDVINLAAPGLESARDYYGTGAAYTAMEEIVSYYRSRTSVINPDADLSSTEISSTARQIADQAIQHRFYTTSYTDGLAPGGLTQYYDMSGSDGSIDWDKIPSGVGTDGTEFNKQIHRLLFTPYLAQAYHATKEEKYVEALISIYDDYISKYPVPSGKASGTPYTGLQLSGKIIGWVDTFPYIISSSKVTPEWLSKMMVWACDMMECVRNNWYSPVTSNIYFAQVQAENEFAIFFPEYASSEEWLDEGSNLVTSQLVTQFNDDGVQNENDLSYHMGVVANFETIQKFVSANGKSSLYPSDYNSYLKNSCRFVMDMLYPDYSDENFNDTRSARQTKSVLLRNLKSYSDMFPDDKEMLWMATEGAEGTKPTTLQQKYATSGYYILRNRWGADGTMLILKNNYNPSNNWHCQPDNGTVALWKGGRRFLPDAGVFTYSTGATRNYYASTAVHNTMTLNGQTIADGYMKGKYLGSGHTDAYDYIVTENASYSNLTHRRAVFMVSGSFFVIVDEGYGTASNTVDVRFNLCADTAGSLGKDAAVIDDLSANFQYGAHTVFSDNNNMLFRTFVDTSTGYKASETTTPVSNEIDVTYDRKAYVVGITKSSTLAARFITVIYPFGAPSEADGIKVSAAFTDNDKGKEGTFNSAGTSVNVTIDGTEYNLEYKL